MSGYPEARDAVYEQDSTADIIIAPVVRESIAYIAIKRAIGKLEAPDNLEAMVEEMGFLHLPITFFHGEQAGCLPMHHHDPFDRMLVAQAQAEGLIIVTKDVHIPLYGVRTFPV